MVAHRWKRQRSLRDAQVEIGLPQHKLVTERQKMIQRLLEQEKAITQVLAANRSTRQPVITSQKEKGLKMPSILFAQINAAAFKLQTLMKCCSVFFFLYIVIHIVFANFLEIS